MRYLVFLIWSAGMLLFAASASVADNTDQWLPKQGENKLKVNAGVSSENQKVVVRQNVPVLNSQNLTTPGDYRLRSVHGVKHQPELGYSSAVTASNTYMGNTANVSPKIKQSHS